MTMKVHGYAASGPKSALAPWNFERREARPDDVTIKNKKGRPL